MKHTNNSAPKQIIHFQYFRKLITLAISVDDHCLRCNPKKNELNKLKTVENS